MPALKNRLPDFPQHLYDSPFLSDQLPRPAEKRHRRALSVSHRYELRSQSKRAIETSSLFLRLPLEIRQQIWRECFAGHGPSGFKRLDKLFSNYFTWHAYTYQNDCALRTARFRNPGSATNNQVSVQGNAFGLLQTCRKVYQEAINILYEVTNFHFEHPWSLLVMFENVSPERWERIQDLAVHWSFMYVMELQAEGKQALWPLVNHQPYSAAYLKGMSLEILAISRLQSFTLCTDIVSHITPDVPPVDDSVPDENGHRPEAKELATLLEPFKPLRLRDRKRWVLELPSYFCDMINVSPEHVETVLDAKGFYCHVTRV